VSYCLPGSFPPADGFWLSHSYRLAGGYQLPDSYQLGAAKAAAAGVLSAALAEPNEEGAPYEGAPSFGLSRLAPR
jgi:hypothetical protein